MLLWSSGEPPHYLTLFSFPLVKSNDFFGKTIFEPEFGIRETKESKRLYLPIGTKCT